MPSYGCRSQNDIYTRVSQLTLRVGGWQRNIALMLRVAEAFPPHKFRSRFLRSDNYSAVSDSMVFPTSFRKVSQQCANQDVRGVR